MTPRAPWMRPDVMATNSGTRPNKRAARWIVAVAIAASSVAGIAGSAHASEQNTGPSGQSVSANGPRTFMHSMGIRW